MKELPKGRTNDIIVQELGKEILVYDLECSKAYCLNETTALVFQFSDGSRTIAEISDMMSVKLKTPVSEEFVRLALTELKNDGLLSDCAAETDFLNGLNRREVIRRIGLASLVALPAVAAVVAPTAIMAASVACVNPGGEPPGAQVLSPADCCSNQAIRTNCIIISGIEFCQVICV